MTLKVLRVAAGLKQSDVERKYGVPQSMQSAYETGKQVPTIETAIVLSIAYGVSIEVLIGALGYDLNSIRERLGAIEHQRQEQSQSQGLDRE